MIKSKPAIDVLVADDHGVIRDALRSLLDAAPDIRVCGAIAIDHDVASVARASDCDVIVIGAATSATDEAALLDKLRAAGVRARAVVVGGLAAAAPGADDDAIGYVSHASDGERLLEAIRAVAGGVRHVDVGGAAPEGRQPPFALSPRERQVLRFVAMGHTNQEAADSLGLSVKTVEGYRSRLMQKLDARNRVQLVRWALRLGLLDDEGQSLE